MKWIIRTYDERREEAEKTKQSLERLGEKDIEIIEAYNGNKYKGCIRTKIGGKGFIDFVIPKLDGECIYVEDCVEVIKLPPKDFEKKDIVFLGYYKVKYNKTKPYSCYIVGSKMVYISENIIKEWHKKKPRLAKTDYFLRREGENRNSLGIYKPNDLFKVRPYVSFFGTTFNKKFYLTN